MESRRCGRSNNWSMTNARARRNRHAPLPIDVFLLSRGGVAIRGVDRMAAERTRSTCGVRHAVRGDKRLSKSLRHRPFSLITEGVMTNFLNYLLVSMTRFSILERDWPVYEGC